MWTAIAAGSAISAANFAEVVGKLIDGGICLALANRIGQPALTADRSWARIPRELLDMEVEFLR